MILSKNSLTKIIKESVKRILRETTRRQKAMRAIKGTSSNIKTCAILTAFNPMTNNLSIDYNRRLNQKLMAYLKIGCFVWFPVKGQYGAKEESFIIYNISCEDALHIGENFEQESIIFIDNRGKNIVYQYWEQSGKGDFRMTHQRDNYLDFTDENDFFTQISRKFKFQIPFFDGNDEPNENILSEHNDIIGKALNKNIKHCGYDLNTVNQKINLLMEGKNVNGKTKYHARGNLYGGYQKFC